MIILLKFCINSLHQKYCSSKFTPKYLPDTVPDHSSQERVFKKDFLNFLGVPRYGGKLCTGSTARVEISEIRQPNKAVQSQFTVHKSRRPHRNHAKSASILQLEKLTRVEWGAHLYMTHSIP